MASGRRPAWATVVEALHLSATLLAVLPFIAGVLAALTGAAVPQVVAAVVISGVLVATGWVAWGRWRKPLVTVPAIAPLGPPAQRLWGQPEPTPWMVVPGDLATLTLDTRELDRAFGRATEEAAQQLGAAVEVRFSSLGLLPNPKFTLRGHSAAARKSCWIEATSGAVNVWAVERDDAGDWRGTYPGVPWRKDKSWRQLTDLSWAAVRPFVGHALMHYWPSPSGFSWRITYKRDEGGVAGLDETYVTQDGRAVRVSS